MPGGTSRTQIALATLRARFGALEANNRLDSSVHLLEFMKVSYLHRYYDTGSLNEGSYVWKLLRIIVVEAMGVLWEG